MSRPFELDGSLQTFSGHAPLFPLPSGVLFPNLVLPLHIFEERYRQMTADALEGDGLIAMALLQPGWERNYESKAASIYPIVCLGSILEAVRLEDGGYHMVLRGLCRAQVLGERSGDEPYRVGHLLPVRETYPSKSTGYWQDCRKAVLAAFRRRFPGLAEDQKLQAVVRDDLCLGTMCDLLCQSLELLPEDAARVLMELDVSRRCEWVLRQLVLKNRDGTEKPAANEGFPPRFSHN